MEPVTTSAIGTRGGGLPRRVRRAAPWLGGAVLVAGIALSIVHFAPNRNAPPQRLTTTPVRVPAKPKRVPLQPVETAVARQFLKTAVARADLAAAWKIAGPNVRGGLTYKDWLTGNIPVVPYPLDAIATARFKVDYSYADEALLEVALLPKPGAKIKPQIFFLGLKRVAGPHRKHWVVDTWVPRSSTLVPRAAD